MKTKIVTTIALLVYTISIACPLCESKQPKGFENITHGEGPNGNIDFIIMYSAIIIVGYTLIMSIKYLVKPKENNNGHIKNYILDDYNTEN